MVNMVVHLVVDGLWVEEIVIILVIDLKIIHEIAIIFDIEIDYFHHLNKLTILLKLTKSTSDIDKGFAGCFVGIVDVLVVPLILLLFLLVFVGETNLFVKFIGKVIHVGIYFLSYPLLSQILILIPKICILMLEYEIKEIIVGILLLIYSNITNVLLVIISRT